VVRSAGPERQRQSRRASGQDADGATHGNGAVVLLARPAAKRPGYRTV